MHPEAVDPRRDLQAARERHARRGDGLSRRADRDQWDKRANAVRERVPILDVVERVVALKRAGGRSKRGCCPFHDEKSPSFTVYPHGGKKVKVGFFVCYGCGKKGDVIHFVALRQKLGWTEAIQLLESQNGVRLLETATPPPRPRTVQADERRKAERAHRLWAESVPLGAGGVVDQYLRGRALVPPALYGIGSPSENGGWPNDLRFHARCWHDLEKREWPAMVAAIRGYDGSLLTVHRTYLARQPDGAWGKAPVDRPKLVVGTWDDGYIRLGPDADAMTGGEGLETSLSAMQLWRRSGLCFVNSGRMKTVELPFPCSDFIYAADKGGRNGTRWGEIFAGEGARLNAVGRRVAVKIPRVAEPKADFNDLREQLAAAAARYEAERRSAEGAA